MLTFAFGDLVNAPECLISFEGYNAIVRGETKIVKLPRITLKSLYSLGPFSGDIWILPSRKKIQTEMGQIQINENVIWRMTRMSSFLYPNLLISGDIEVTPIILENSLRNEIFAFDFPMEIEDNCVFEIRHTDNIKGAHKS